MKNITKLLKIMIKSYRWDARNLNNTFKTSDYVYNIPKFKFSFSKMKTSKN
jgi:hypothetical protein